MGKDISILSIVISCIIFGFIIYEWIRPVSSIIILIAAVCISILGFACAIIGANGVITTLSVIAVLLSLIAMAAMLMLFIIMMIMGM